MKINKPSNRSKPGRRQKPAAKKSKQPWWKTLCEQSRWPQWVAAIILLALVAGGLVYTGMTIRPKLTKWVYYAGITTENPQLKPALKALGIALIKAPGRYMASVSSPQQPEVIDIHIKFKHLDKIHKKRNEALARGILIQGEDDYVPASIQFHNQELKAKVRLKGDWSDHLKGNKWSLRVIMKGKDQVLGMRRFSLQAPWTRGYQGEILFMETLKRFDVLVPRYFFVRVTVNGKDIGLMALEEHFGKELLESQGRKESVILKFDESLFWQGIVNKHKEGGVYHNFKGATIDSFATGQIKKNPVLKQDLKTATSLLRSFVDGTLAPSQVFDTDKMGQFLAAAELWDVWHTITWPNVRYYYNPQLGKLEPIGFDANVHQINHSQGLMVPNKFPISRALLDDPLIKKAYLGALNTLITDVKNGTLLSQLQQVEAPYLKTLHQEFPLLNPVDLSLLQQRARQLESITPQNFTAYRRYAYKAPGTPYPKLIQAYLINQNGSLAVELHNLIDEPVTITKIRWKGTNKYQPYPTSNQPIRLKPTLFEEKTQRVILPSSIPFSETLKVEVTAVNQTDKEPQIVSAVPYVAAANKPVLVKPSLDQVLTQHSFLSWNETSKHLETKAGHWQVNTPLVLPENVPLNLNAGTHLSFSADAHLLAFAPVYATGNSQAPVTLDAIDPKAGWQGMAVMNASQPSQWHYVNVRHTRGLQRGAWSVTGAVTFYNSDVLIDNSSFTHNQAEDALNIVRSQFTLNNVSIMHTRSDAFDADFATGSVTGGTYRNIGGDGVDVSGTTITVNNVRFDGVHDKAVSIGEASTAKASHLLIQGSGTGVACKDNSRIEITDSQLDNIQHVGLMAYIKKPEYGPARIKASKINFTQVPKEAIAQTGSGVQLNGKTVAEEDIDVDKLYKQGYMKK